MDRRVLVINEKDNVGVLLENAVKGDQVHCQGKTIVLLEPIEFAHKVALVDIPATRDVVKYGENIGFALSDIKQGQWVHTHNMGCQRGK
jgi:altronate dehydratase small subunit